MKLSERLSKIGNGIIYGLSFAAIVYVLIVSLFNTCVMTYTDEHIYYLKNPAIVIVAGLFVLLWMLRIGYRKVHLSVRVQKVILVMLTAIYLIAVTVMILQTRLYPEHDPRSVYEAAEQFLQRNYAAWQQDGYLYMFPYQNGLLLLELPFIALFGAQAYLALQLYHMVLWLLTMCGLAYLAAQLWGNAAGKLTYVGLLLFLPMWGYTTYLYGNLPGLAFAIGSFVCAHRFWQQGKVRQLVGGSVLMVISIMYKSHFAIFAIALICIGILKGLEQVGKEKESREPRAEGWQRTLLLIGVTVIAMFVATKGIPLLMHEITGADTAHGVPLISNVAVGVNESNIAPGWYNKLVVLAYEAGAGTDLAAMRAYSWGKIHQSLQLFRDVPSYCVAFFGRKIASIWSQPAFECFTTLTKRNMDGTLSYAWKDLLYNGGIGNTVLLLFMDVMQSITYFGALMYLLLFRGKESEKKLMMLTFLGGFLFHIIWEGKAQYTIMFYVMLLPYAAYGWYLAVQAERKQLKKILA
nr:hypothetical protein [Lachnospiraceae bacterium]